MRKNIWTRRVATSVLGISMAMQFLPAAPAVFAQESTDETQSSNQMVSAPETVYQNVYGAQERSVDFNSNWKFSLGDAGNAQNSAYDDSEWRTLNLPHDYSIEQDYTASGEAESAYLPGGLGWYRKTFSVSDDVKGKKVSIVFDGVYMNATVYLNGKKLGDHAYGYTAFAFDLTDELNYDGENILAVKVDHKTPSSRWYSGSGIYRDVKLVVRDQVSVGYNGTFVTTPNLEEEQNGEVTTNVKTKVENGTDTDKTLTVRQSVLDKDGQAVGTASGTVTVAAGGSETSDLNVMVETPALWSPESPALYTVKTEILDGDAVVDTVETEFGYKYYKSDANSGFFLNGKNIKLKGVCMHHDQGALGAESVDDAVARQVRILKEMGCNAIRVTHNPASQELLNECSRQGILVINEIFDTWTNPKNGNSQDYSRHFNTVVADDNAVLNKQEGDTWAEFDVRAAVESSRNQASLIGYSLGNEIFEGISGYSGDYADIAEKMCRWVKESDPYTTITFGDNYLKGGNSSAQAVAQKIHEAGGTVGLNYANGSQYENVHRQFPNWMLYGSETASHVNSRGYYKSFNGNKQEGSQLTSYDNSCVGWGHVASDAWYQVITRDFMAGEFVWTGFDYLGEPTPWNGTGSGFVSADGNSPKNSYFGIIDTAGLPKDNYYLYQSQWNDDVHTLHVLPAWNNDVVYKDYSGNVPVVVYSDAASVELFFTPKGSTEKQSLGKKTFTKKTTPNGFTYQVYEGSDKNGTDHKNLYLTWNVPYADGKIEAVAYDENNAVIDSKTTKGRNIIETNGAAAKLHMDADKTDLNANGQDLSYIEISVLDENGVLVPDAANRVKVTVEGEGRLVALDNGRQNDYQSYYDDNRAAYNGKLVAIVQATSEDGDFTVTAEAEGLEPATLNGTSAPVEGVSGKLLSSLVYSRTYYVKTGTRPTLPLSVQASYTDGTSEELPVIWDEISDEDLATPGVLRVGGKVQGGSVSVLINVIDEIGAVLGSSTTTPAGVLPALPASRPVVLANGTQLDASLPVVWPELNAEDFAAPGIKVVEGKTIAFGQEYPVTCSVRIEEGETSIGNSLSTVARASEDTPENLLSDTLSAIVDGNTVYDPNAKDGDRNTTAWSNYNYSFDYPEHTTSVITFRYDTQRSFGRFVVHFGEDTWSASFPDPNTIKFEISEDGNIWNELQTTETIGEKSGYTKPYTYDFDPMTATYIRMTVVNTATKKPSNGNNPCTLISEVEMLEAVKEEITANSSADLSELKINGEAVDASALESGTTTTSARKVTIEPISSANAAITVLFVPEKNLYKIYTESEDGSASRVYTVMTGVENVDPADGSKDIALNLLHASAASQYNGGDSHEGPASYAIDNNTATHWHTNWDGGGFCSSDDDRWFQLSLDEPTWVDAWRYLPRRYNGNNGFISRYRVEYKNDAGEWTVISRGTFDYADHANWQIALFDEPVKAKDFRLVAEATYSNDVEDSRHVSASEFRLRGVTAKVFADLENLRVEAPTSISVDSVSAANPAVIDIKLYDGDKLLSEDADYYVTFVNNTSYGKAAAVITGIGNYAGTIRHEFMITNDSQVVVVNAALASLPAKTNYIEDEFFDPSGLAVELSKSDGTTERVAYSAETASRFTFTPALDTPLATNMTSVEAGIEGHTVNIPITVASSIIPMDPADDSRDIDCSILSAADGSHQEGNAKQGPAAFALDGDTTTMWHTKWAGDDRANMWIELTSETDMRVDGVRVLPRQDSDVNGIITSYRVEAMNAEGEWATVAEGRWPSNHQWQIAQFKPVTTKKIRLTALEADHDVAKEFASAAEIRLTAPDETPVEEANKVLLRQAIERAELAQADASYSKVHPTIRAAFEKALADAKTVNANPKATQSEVNAAWSRLTQLIQMLGMTADKTELQALTNVCDAVNLDQYVDGAAEKAEFTAALANAHAVLEDPDALDETSIIPAYNRLKAAYDAVIALDHKPEVEVDTSRLERLIRLTKDTDLSKYLDYGTTKEDFRQALAHAQAVAAAPESQTQVDQAVAALSNAYLNLRLIPDESIITPSEADKTLLGQAITRAQEIIASDDYQTMTPASRAELEAALHAAQSVFDKEDAAQEEIDNAYQQLSQAIQKLNVKGDKDALNAAIQAAKGVNTDDFIGGEAEKAALAEAIAAAEAVAADENATQEEIDAAKAALEAAKAAVEALERKPVVVVDTRLLEKIIALTENTDLSQYVADETIDAFTAALVNGRAVAANPQSDSQVSQAVNELNQAYLNLRLRASEDLLKELAGLVQTLSSINFGSNAELAAKADKLIRAIDQGISNPSLFAQEQAEQLKAEAEELIKSGKELGGTTNKPADIDTPIEPNIGADKPADEKKEEVKPNTDASVKPSSTNKSVKTSAATNALGLGAAFAAASAGLLALLRRRNKK